MVRKSEKQPSVRLANCYQSIQSPGQLPSIHLGIPSHPKSFKTLSSSHSSIHPFNHLPIPLHRSSTTLLFHLTTSLPIHPSFDSQPSHFRPSLPPIHPPIHPPFHHSTALLLLHSTPCFPIQAFDILSHLRTSLPTSTRVIRSFIYLPPIYLSLFMLPSTYSSTYSFIQIGICYAGC